MLMRYKNKYDFMPNDILLIIKIGKKERPQS